MLTFVVSLVWIAFYSYMLVWWATIVGDMVGIPTVIMGYTFLAAGTSICGVTAIFSAAATPCR